MWHGEISEHFTLYQPGAYYTYARYMGKVIYGCKIFILSFLCPVLTPAQLIIIVQLNDFIHAV